MVKRIAKIATLSVVSTLVIILVFTSILRNIQQLPTSDEIREYNNVSNALSEEAQQTIKKSRASTVRILSIGEEDGIAVSTGTYFTYDGDYYVLTVSHGILSDCENTKVWSPTVEFADCAKIVINDPLVDYAIIQIEEMPSMKPVEMPDVLPRGKAWRPSLSAQTKVYYTGYPNSTGPLTLGGRIVGYADGGYFYIDSFAWAGSSGSGVFSADGKYLGYILAIDIGQTEYGVDVLENLVIVVPAFMINWSTLSEQSGVLYKLIKKGKEAYEER